ncbi:MAG: Y-family DNA polymerase [Pseudomonadales bacterium]|nr:Y-family DNA polymerase [Pseudomonadales bacterium]
MYALVDCNSFYASCEQIFRPDLRDQPVVVLSNNDGCIVARSKEAKALNIPDLEAYFKQRDFLAKHNVKVFSSNYELYADISNRVTEVLSEFCTDMEVYSIDESFMMLPESTGAVDDYVDYGMLIKDTVWRDVRMPVCVGMGRSKTLSKLANHIAKKSKRLNGVCVINEAEPWYPVFKKLPVNKVWGIGSRISTRLSYIGVHSVYDLIQRDAKELRAYFGVNVERTQSELMGHSCYDLEQVPPAKKQIFSTRSFGVKVETLQGLEQAVSQYASQAAVKLRKQDCLVKQVLVFIETSRFIENRYNRKTVVQLVFPTNDTSAIVAAAKKGLRSIFKDGYRYHKAGVGLLDIKAKDPFQLNFFNTYQSPKSQQLMAVIDKINKHKQQVFFASSGIDPQWKMQRVLKSPAYTTQLDELPLVKM